MRRREKSSAYSSRSLVKIEDFKRVGKQLYEPSPHRKITRLLLSLLLKKDKKDFKKEKAVRGVFPSQPYQRF